MDPMKCPACRAHTLKTEEERGRSLCDACSKGVGTPRTLAQIPALRPATPCARCNQPRFVRALVRERAPDNEGVGLAPLSLSFKTSEAGVFTMYHRANTAEPRGILVGYACLGCGFTELYTWDPGRIPIGPQYGTELVDVSSHSPDGGPFR